MIPRRKTIRVIKNRKIINCYSSVSFVPMVHKKQLSCNCMVTVGIYSSAANTVFHFLFGFSYYPHNNSYKQVRLKKVTCSASEEEFDNGYPQSQCDIPNIYQAFLSLFVRAEIFRWPKLHLEDSCSSLPRTNHFSLTVLLGSSLDLQNPVLNIQTRGIQYLAQWQ